MARPAPVPREDEPMRATNSGAYREDQAEVKPQMSC
jgi:hypothetical protein